MKDLGSKLTPVSNKGSKPDTGVDVRYVVSYEPIDRVDVEAAEIDTLAVAAIGLNALENGVDVRAVFADVVGSACRWDVILCGDVCYEGPMTRHIFPWLRQMARAGAEVWIADPGRAYLPVEALVEIGRFCITTTRELEDREERETRVFRVSG